MSWSCCCRATSFDVSSVLLLDSISPLVLELESGTSFLGELHSLYEPVAAFIAMGYASPGLPVPLDVGTLFARHVVPMFFEIRLVDPKIPGMGRPYRLGRWSASCSVPAGTDLTTALWYIVTPGDHPDLG